MPARSALNTLPVCNYPSGKETNRQRRHGTDSRCPFEQASPVSERASNNEDAEKHGMLLYASRYDNSCFGSIGNNKSYIHTTQAETMTRLPIAEQDIHRASRSPHGAAVASMNICQHTLAGPFSSEDAGSACARKFSSKSPRGVLGKPEVPCRTAETLTPNKTQANTTKHGIPQRHRDEKQASTVRKSDPEGEEIRKSKKSREVAATPQPLKPDPNRRLTKRGNESRPNKECCTQEESREQNRGRRPKADQKINGGIAKQETSRGGGALSLHVHSPSSSSCAYLCGSFHIQAGTVFIRIFSILFHSPAPRHKQ